MDPFIKTDQGVQWQQFYDYLKPDVVFVGTAVVGAAVVVGATVVGTAVWVVAGATPVVVAVLFT